MTYRYVVGEGWIGKEPPNNLCKYASAPDWHTRPTYDFVDVHSTGTPVRIHGKKQWKEHLRRNGLTDDISWRDGQIKKNAELSYSHKKQIDSVIDKAISVVKTRPYSAIGRTIGADQLRREFSQQRRRST